VSFPPKTLRLETLTISLQQYTGGRDRVISQEKEIKDINIGKKETKL
jgi:hypothetical protein